MSLIEGGLKAYVFAHLAARIAVIGAAEGQFWQSAEQLRHSLARLGAAEAVLFPDTGAVENDKVLHKRTDDYFFRTRNEPVDPRFTCGSRGPPFHPHITAQLIFRPHIYSANLRTGGEGLNPSLSSCMQW